MNYSLEPHLYNLSANAHKEEYAEKKSHKFLYFIFSGLEFRHLIKIKFFDTVNNCA